MLTGDDEWAERGELGSARAKDEQLGRDMSEGNEVAYECNVIYPVSQCAFPASASHPTGMKQTTRTIYHEYCTRHRSARQRTAASRQQTSALVEVSLDEVVSTMASPYITENGEFSETYLP